MALGNARNSLRLSLLASIGLVPLACGGNAESRAGNEAGATKRGTSGSEEKARTCFTGVCGRPFLIEAQARVAAVTPNTAWLSSTLAQPQVAHLTAAERAALARHWQRLGQMEHASIAAFARFSLQLLALGAPSELVEACTQALADETEHAKVCFKLASSYAGQALGPGPLDIGGSLGCVSLGDIVDLVLAEGCFGETSAALDALEAADTATDPVLREVYAKIASDEQRHAELAFRFLRWALTRDAPVVRRRIAASVAEPPSHHQAAREVTVPCLNALLGRPLGFATIARA
ncbi:MAG: ferritin-like domain-containing protein [Myxococcales bacterium]